MKWWNKSYSERNYVKNYEPDALWLWQMPDESPFLRRVVQHDAGPKDVWTEDVDEKDVWNWAGVS